MGLIDVSEISVEPLVALLAGERWAALATLDEGGAPLASQVAFVPQAGTGDLLLHLSTLAPHARYLMSRPRCALLVGRPDRGDGDPQTLPRLGLQGEAFVVTAEEAGFDAARQTYLQRLPHAEQRFGFADFRLFRLRTTRAHYVGGFAQAFSVDDRAQLVDIIERAARIINAA